MKRSTYIAFAAICVASLALSGCMSTEQVGPTRFYSRASLKNTQNRSVALDSIMYHKATTSIHGCPIDRANACASVLDLRLVGPAAIMAYEEQTGATNVDVSQSEIIRRAEDSWSHVGMWAASLAASNAMISQGSPALAGLGLFLSLGSGSGPKVNPVPGDYDSLATKFRANEVLWIAKYFTEQKNPQEELNQIAHKGINLSSLEPSGWASGITAQGTEYKIANGIWNSGAEGTFTWLPQEKHLTKAPAIAPYELNWIVQPWKKASDPFYLVNKNDPKYPFMALATIEYKIQPGFDVPAWIQKHQQQLAHWMVIYHEKGHAVVWKDGVDHQYPDPTPLPVTPAK